MRAVFFSIGIAAGLGVVFVVVMQLIGAARAETQATLEPVSAFRSIADERERSIALFAEAGKVINSPRCLNCHPADSHPRQGEDMHVHEPPVQRGIGGMGVAGMRCTTCHGTANYDPAEVPGHPRWLLAPIEMAWIGKSLGEICRQLKDPARNGDKTMEEMVEHMAHDSLVGWGWNPGAGRTPAPGTQEEFGALIKAWVDTGAHCAEG
jgi:hypothetical protein